MGPQMNGNYIYLTHMYQSRKRSRKKGPAIDKMGLNDLLSLKKSFSLDLEKFKNISSDYNDVYKKLKKIDKEEFDAHLSLKEFVQRNLKKTYRIKTYKEFFFVEKEYKEYDIYFETTNQETTVVREIKEIVEFFLKKKKIINDFSIKYGFARGSEEERWHDNTFFNNENTGKKQLIRIESLWLDAFDKLFKSVIEQNGYGSELALTERTKSLANKIYRISIDKKVSKHLRNVSIIWKYDPSFFPCMPYPNFVKSYEKERLNYFTKIIRKIDLRIRSIKRNKEMSANLYYIYVMKNRAYPDIYKIGWTSDLPEERAEQLTSTGVLYPWKVVFEKQFKDAEKIEKKVHSHFKKYRVKANKEFFKIDLNTIKTYISSIK